ncbi:MAG: exonuclease domain-containing protein [Clostridia bacterium]
MNYLAFDIEAANGYKRYSICSVGVVIADENFNVIFKENIYVNPKAKYDLNGTRANVGIDLHLSPELLKASPTFDKIYDRLAKLLTGDYIVLGHAVVSDVIMLNSACKHYRLPPINFNFICSQLLFKAYKGDKEVRSLSKIAEQIGVVFTPHDSLEDAYVSLLTIKYLVEQTGQTVEQLMAKYSIRVGSTINFELIHPVIMQEGCSKKVKNNSIGKLYDYIRATKFVKISDKFSDVVFALDRIIELDNFANSVKILNEIYANGGKYSAKLAQANYYVSNSTANSSRTRAIITLANAGKLKIITLQEFYEMLNE